VHTHTHTHPLTYAKTTCREERGVYIEWRSRTETDCYPAIVVCRRADIIVGEGMKKKYIYIINTHTVIFRND